MTFTARKPTEKELDDQDLEWHDLTSDKEWSPRDMTDDEGGTSFDPTVATLQNISEDVEEKFFDCEPINDDTPLAVSYTHLTLPTIYSV